MVAINDFDPSSYVPAAEPAPPTPRPARNRRYQADLLTIKRDTRPIMTGQSVGDILKQARTARGENVAQIAEILRIKPNYIDDLEKDDYANMPGRPYVLGFLRSYATYLQLNPTDLVNRAKASFDSDQATPEPSPEPAARSKKTPKPTQDPATILPASSSRRKRPRVGLALVGLLLLGGLFAAYRYLAPQLDQSTPPPVAEAPTSLLEQEVASVLDENSAAGGSAAGQAPTGQATDAAGPGRNAPLTGDDGRAAQGVAQAEPAEAVTASSIIEGTTGTANAGDTASAGQVGASLGAGAGAGTGVAGNDSGATDNTDASAPVAADGLATAPTDTASSAATAQGDDAPLVTTDALTGAADAAATLPDSTGASATDSADLAAATDAAAPEGAGAPAQDTGTQAAASTPGLAAADANALIEQPADAATDTAQAPQLVLIADTESWIQVQSEDQAFRLQRILQPGDRFELPQRGDLSLWTGNAGGVRILLDGEEFGPFGPIGAVRRNIPLTSDALSAESQAGN